MKIYNPYRVRGHFYRYDYGLFVRKDRVGNPSAKKDMLDRMRLARKTKYEQRLTCRFWMQNYRVGFITQHPFKQRKVLKIVKKKIRYTEDLNWKGDIPVQLKRLTFYTKSKLCIRLGPNL